MPVVSLATTLNENPTKNTNPGMNSSDLIVSSSQNDLNISQYPKYDTLNGLYPSYNQFTHNQSPEIINVKDKYQSVNSPILGDSNFPNQNTLYNTDLNNYQNIPLNNNSNYQNFSNSSQSYQPFVNPNNNYARNEYNHLPTPVYTTNTVLQNNISYNYSTTVNSKYLNGNNCQTEPVYNSFKNLSLQNNCTNNIYDNNYSHNQFSNMPLSNAEYNQNYVQAQTQHSANYQNLNQYNHLENSYQQSSINTMLPNKNSKYGYNRPVNLFQNSQIFPYEAEKAPSPSIPENLEPFSCPTEYMRCSLNSVPQTHSLLDKIRLPFGIMIHPFNDKQEIPLVTDQVMARCKVCRTYINPFVILLDTRHWKCNVCYRTNELPEEYYYDASTKAYLQPYQRAELQNAAVEFVASSDYMIRPPQPAVYLFLLEVTIQASRTDYLRHFCQVLESCLDDLPGDSRTLLGFVTFDKRIHFYRFDPTSLFADVLICPDIEEPFLPDDENLLVNLQEFKKAIRYFLNHQLPELWCFPLKDPFTKIDEENSQTNTETTTNIEKSINPSTVKMMDLNDGNCLGPALQICQKLISHTGGRISILLNSIPDTGEGKLAQLNCGDEKRNSNSLTLGAKTDFYKKTALELSNDQISADIFFLNQVHIDLASLATLSKYSAGSMYHFPSYHSQNNQLQAERFTQCLKRYLTRDIGFEAVMRVRATKGLALKGFFGNFFLRSSNLLCLPNVKSDTSFSVQCDIDEDLVDSSMVGVQVAILYTVSKGERRIRVLTLALPVTNNFDDVINSVDQEVVVSLIAIMASDRCLSTNLHSSREAMITAVQDFLSAFNTHAYISVTYSNLLCPDNCSLLVARIHALLKHTAFRLTSSSNKDLDERAFALYSIQSKPIETLLNEIYPSLFSVNYLASDDIKESSNEMSKYCSYVPVCQLSSKQLEERNSYLLDLGELCLVLSLSRFTPIPILKDLFGNTFSGSSYAKLDENQCEISPESKIAGFLDCLQSEKPYFVPIMIIKDDGPNKNFFKSYMYDDRTESSMSYHEFLLYLVKEIIS
ncbi:protein transport protein Sec24A-like [Gordionus sp. m RMFG-2023]|uniref:protein transport protein Sec24A-like n=1 Tax=Gordionus sp. m RMFG-2023 TaxID=3053472 RepID=UPI0031FDA5FD